MIKLTPQELKKIQSKLAKLMALSASPNEAESAAALSKCQELMEKYGIASIDVDPIRKTVDTNSVFVESRGRSKIPKWMGILVAELSDIFDCIGIINHSNKNWNGITFIGGASDVQILADLYTRLRHVISNMGRRYIMDFTGVVPLNPNSKEDYCSGVVFTVVKRIKSIYRPPGKELVLLKKEFVKKHCDYLFPRTKTAKFGINTTDKTDYLSMQRGILDGNNVTINKTIK